MVYYAFGNINNVHRTFYVDRKVERDRLEAILLRGGSAIIKGRPRVGKSAFVEKFKERFSGEFEFAYIICKGTAISYDSEMPPWEQLRSKVEEGVPKENKRCGKDDRPRVLVLDEFNHLITTLKDISQTKLLDVLNYLNDLLRNDVRLVLVTQMSMYEMVAKFPALLQALPASETMDLIDIMPFSISQTDCYCRHSKAKVDKIAIEDFYKITDGLVGGLNVLLQNYNLNFETITAKEIVSDPDVTRKLEDLGCLKAHRNGSNDYGAGRGSGAGSLHDEHPVLTVDLASMNIDVNGRTRGFDAMPVQFAILVLSLVKSRDCQPSNIKRKLEIIAGAEKLCSEFSWCRRLQNGLGSVNLQDTIRRIRKKIESPKGGLLYEAGIKGCLIVPKGPNKKKRIKSEPANWSKHISVRWIYNGKAYSGSLPPCLSMHFD